MITLFSVAFAVIIGLLMTRVIKRFGLPAVTAYLIAGVLIGPYGLGRLGVSFLGFTSMEQMEKLSLLSDVALGFIAFAIGNEFRLSAAEGNRPAGHDRRHRSRRWWRRCARGHRA